MGRLLRFVIVFMFLISLISIELVSVKAGCVEERVGELFREKTSPFYDDITKAESDINKYEEAAVDRRGAARERLLALIAEKNSLITNRKAKIDIIDAEKGMAFCPKAAKDCAEKPVPGNAVRKCKEHKIYHICAYQWKTTPECLLTANANCGTNKRFDCERKPLEFREMCFNELDDYYNKCREDINENDVQIKVLKDEIKACKERGDRVSLQTNIDGIVACEIDCFRSEDNLRKDCLAIFPEKDLGKRGDKDCNKAMVAVGKIGQSVGDIAGRISNFLKCVGSGNGVPIGVKNVKITFGTNNIGSSLGSNSFKVVSLEGEF